MNTINPPSRFYKEHLLYLLYHIFVHQSILLLLMYFKINLSIWVSFSSFITSFDFLSRCKKDFRHHEADVRRHWRSLSVVGVPCLVHITKVYVKYIFYNSDSLSWNTYMHGGISRNPHFWVGPSRIVLRKRLKE